MAKSKLVKANEKIAENVTTGFKKMSDGVVDGFNKMSDAIVGGYTKIEDKFVDEFLTKDGETVSDAKKRLKQEENEKRNVIRNYFRNHWWINFCYWNVYVVNTRMGFI